MEERLGYNPDNIYQIGAAIASNSGPKAVVISFTRKKARTLMLQNGCS